MMEKMELLNRFADELAGGKNPTIKQYEEVYGPLAEETKEELATIKMLYLSRGAFVPPPGFREKTAGLTEAEQERPTNGFNAATIFRTLLQEQGGLAGTLTIPDTIIKRTADKFSDYPKKIRPHFDNRASEHHLHLNFITTSDTKLQQIEKRLKGKMRQETRLLMEFIWECFSPLRQLNKDRAEEILIKAREIYLKKDYQTALVYYNRAIRLNQDSDEAWTGRGVTLRRLKQPEEALKSLEKATALNPRNDKAWSNRGIALCELKYYEKALPFYDKAIKLNPTNHWAYFGKANALMELKKYPEALECYQKVTEIEPNYTEALVYTSVLLFINKRYEDALKTVDRILEQYPSVSEIWKLKGELLKRMKREEEARQYFQKARELERHTG